MSIGLVIDRSGGYPIARVWRDRRVHGESSGDTKVSIWVALLIVDCV